MLLYTFIGRRKLSLRVKCCFFRTLDNYASPMDCDIQRVGADLSTLKGRCSRAVVHDTLNLKNTHKNNHNEKILKKHVRSEVLP